MASFLLLEISDPHAPDQIERLAASWFDAGGIC